MSFTGRIRLYLIIIALLPPALMMTVVYFYSQRQDEVSYRQNAAADLRRLIAFRDQHQRALLEAIREVLDSEWYLRMNYEFSVNPEASPEVDATLFGLDFLELIDSNDRVVASYRRPGLIGEKIELPGVRILSSRAAISEGVEYDVNGPHAVLAVRAVGDGIIGVYGGWYLERRFVETADGMIRGVTRIILAEDSSSEAARFARMEFGALYEHQGRYQAIVSGNQLAGFYAVADFEPVQTVSVFAPFIDVITIVALASVLIAVGLGMYISGKARKEIRNLIDGFGRVAGGDFSTPVMAYEEGEFAQLADSFSEMTRKLRVSQQQLAVSEKIAGWQAMARKIAHEIKNPLTPIAISADDLRRSYQDGLPEFDRVLDTNTRMIKEETARLARLLDEFSRFARLKTPEVTDVSLRDLLQSVVAVYNEADRAGRLAVDNRSVADAVRVDADLLKQVLVNLVKNALETGENVRVTITATDIPEGLELRVTDTGPGFDIRLLEHGFEPYVSHKQHGAGLGLVICQRIVHDHGGLIELSNHDAAGATVRIVLPRA
jgi:signal transduction histidine kinase